MGLPMIHPTVMPQLLAIAPRNEIIRASEQPNNPRAVAYLRRVFSEVGLIPTEQPAEAEAANDGTEVPAGTQSRGKDDRLSIHVYGGKAALCFEVDVTRNGSPTIALDAAQALGGQHYNWSKKTRLQLTRAELPVVTAVLLGVLPRCEFKNHGVDKSKGFSLERQGPKVFIKVFAKDEGVKAVPVEAPDVFYVAGIFISQLQKTFPGIDASGIAALVKSTQQPFLGGQTNGPRGDQASR